MDYSKSTNIIDRLGNLWFKSTEFVKVMNIDDEPFNWQFCTEEDIQVAQGGLTATRRAKVEKFTLAPGQEMEIPGNIAFVFIDALVKHLIQKDGKAKMINVVSEQDKWIERVFLGKKGIELPYAANADSETGSRSYKAAEITKDPLDPFETPFPELNEATSERPAPAQA